MLAFPDGARLRDAAAAAPPSALVLVRVDDPDTSDRGWFQERDLPPSIPVVGLVARGAAVTPEVRTLIGERLSGIAAVERELASVGAWQLRRAHARPFKRRIEAGLSGLVSGRALLLLRSAVEVVVDRAGAAALAARLGVGERTAADWFRRSGLPFPGRVLAWLRVLLGVALMEEPRAIQNVAHGAGYSNAHAFRRAVLKLLPDASPDLRAVRWEDACFGLNDVLRASRRLAAGSARR